jgi:hypothetical protein
MHRCALVSVNGGTNLLIGASTTSGGWQPLVVPPECATVWDEAEKDVCFGAAARRAIAAAPLAWLARAPAKLVMTFDYFGAGPWYLHSSAPQAFDQHDKERLGALDVIASRLVLLAALFVSLLRTFRPARLAGRLAAGAAAVPLMLLGWIGYLAIPACAAVAGRRAFVSGPSIVSFTAVAIVATAAVHAVFFGAGRYGLAVVPFVAGLAFAPPVAPAAPAAPPAPRAS